jgi:hypothetical protein
MVLYRKHRKNWKPPKNEEQQLCMKEWCLQNRQNRMCYKCSDITKEITRLLIITNQKLQSRKVNFQNSSTTIHSATFNTIHQASYVTR